MSSIRSQFSAEGLFLLFSCLLLCWAMATVPLLDPSEARYATIAQRIVLSGNWLVPEINRGDGFVPFWGKPPLHVWMVAASMKLFGFTEFAARVPSFLGLCGVMYLGVLFAREFFGGLASRILPYLFLTSPLLLLIALTCIVDATFYFWITLALVSFAFAAKRECAKGWSYLFFAALGAAFLTKGPLALVLVGFVVILWIVVTRSWGVLGKAHWVGGICTFLAVTCPWFFFADKASPGLVEYFFYNENFQRFTSVDYVDLYGTSHPTFRGVMFLYFLAPLFPVGFLFLDKFLSLQAIRSFFAQNPWRLFVFLWAISPATIFLPSNNVLITYILPGLPGLFLFYAECIEAWPERCKKVIQSFGTIFFAILAAAGSIVFIITHFQLRIFIIFAALLTATFFVFRSQNKVVARGSSISLGIMIVGVWSVIAFSPLAGDTLSTRALIGSLQGDDRTAPLAFLKKLPYSALFYLQAEPESRSALPTKSPDGLNVPGDFAVKRNQLSLLTPEQQSLLETDSGTDRWAVIDADKDRE